MSAGGYIYEQVDLAYDENTNGETVRSWALAVHIARCRAFYLAAQREATSFGGDGWSPMQTNLYNEFSEYQDRTYYYIQDIHPTTVDTNLEYPAFVSFFEHNNSSEEYCIITYIGFNGYYSNPTTQYNYGLYLPKKSLARGSNNQGYISCGASMSHAFAKNGFGNYDVCSANFITTDCTFIMPAYSQNEGSESSYVKTNYSLIGARSSNKTSSNLVGVTYQFGYAIKGTQIITLERRSTANGWLWSIIGTIFGTLIDPNDTHNVGCIANDYYGESGDNSDISVSHASVLSNNSGAESRISFCKSSGAVNKPSDSWLRNEMSRSLGSYGIYPCCRTDNTIPEDTRYNSVCVGEFAYNFSSTTDDSGVDGNGNGCKGFINTDILRQVSAGVCQTCGAVFQGGNFVSMKASSGSSVGWLLGWDSSNQSIM